jgi:hypothetical protein
MAAPLVTLAALPLAFAPARARDADGPKAKDDPAPAAPGFRRSVRPVVEKYCLGCHGERRPKGGINLAKSCGDDDAIQHNPDLWLQVADVLSERTMPPEGKPGPSEDERHGAADAIQAALDAMETVVDPGRNPIQRLTRDQYNRTVRDLLGVDTHPADAFPADGGGGAGFDNNASTLFVPPILMEKYLAAAADVLDKADPDRWRVAAPAGEVSRDEAARACIERFAAQAFRRPVEPAEVERFLGLFRRADQKGRPFDDAVKLALRAVLVSPHFLFLVEKDQKADGPYRVSEYELANRLSYFLWSSMPDDTLFDLAAKNSLHEPGVLEAQVRRMLADPRSRAFAESFAGQWLRVATLAQAAEPDRRKFPEYTPELRDAMAEEPVAFFHALLRDDRPVLDLLGADYTYVNERLAGHYGIEGVIGDAFRKVEITDPNRGGVLGMAGVLTLTSYPRRTSPVLRGKWILEELLGTPPPPPPAMVKVLPQNDSTVNGKTFRQRLEQHRSKVECASCHAKLDPPGFALEYFDGIGRWRNEIGGQPVDAAGELATGEKFTGPAELKAVLIQGKKDLFVRNLVRRTLAYALRRGLEYYDARAVNTIAEALESNGYRATVLVVGVAESFPFQYRRNDDAKLKLAGAKP